MSTFTLDGSKYTIKLRPGTIKFLKDMSKLYEMHVYTMGTRAYAKAVAAVIDPTMELFQDRILTRDENGSLTKKRLDRLFPADQSKVVVLDDRADVWDYSPNLIQIKPYEYFAGVGDINAPPNAQSTKLIPTEIIKEGGEDVNTADVNNKEEVKVNGPSSTVNNKQEFKANPKAANSTVDKKNKIEKSQKVDKANSDSSSDGLDSDSSSDESDVETDDKNNNFNKEISSQENNRLTSSNSQQNGDDQKKDDSESKILTQISLNSKEADEENLEQNKDVDNKVQTKDNTVTSEPANSINKHNEDEPKKESVIKQESNSIEFESSNAQINGDSDSKESPSNGILPQAKPNNSILASFDPQHEDPDRILEVINKTLTDVHNEFYRRVDKGEPEPHVAIILPKIKQNVLKDCALVFSGVIPLHYRAQDASIWRMATSFGADCLEELTGKVTHLVAANVRIYSFLCH
jgi:RNA polymerase II subunit A-like phosphatase